MRIPLMMTAMILAGMVAGYEIGIFPSVATVIMPLFNINLERMYFVAAVFPFSAALSAIVSGWLADQLGRRFILIVAVILFFLGIFESAVSESIYEFILGRFLLGLSVGVIAVGVPLYLVELAPAFKRGQWVACYFVAMNVGIFLGCFVSVFTTSHQYWRVVMLLGVAPTSILYFLCWYLPESPRWLIKQGQQGLAGQVLIKFFGSKQAMSIINRMEAVHHRSIYQSTKLWTVPGIKVLLLGILVNIFAQAAGIHSVVIYATIMIEKLDPQKYFINISSSLIIACMFILAAIIATRTLDSIPRRRVLMLGLCGMVTSLVLITWTLHNVDDPDFVNFVVLFGSALFIVCQGFSLAPIASLLPAEIFPQSLRGVGVGVSIAAYWITNMIVVDGFKRMLSQYGPNISFIVFLVFAVMAFLWSYFNVPETRSVPLERLEKNFMEGHDNRKLGVEDELSELGMI